ncbi:MAG: DUF805 domain-containing protein [Alphaproteobacteria bacterium]|nr:DUF805 domain-containing protein [Alphaproteobacteria bacterium]
MEMLEKIIAMYVGGFRKFLDFKGRSGKFEFWSFTLMNTLVTHIIGYVGKFGIVLLLLAIVYGFAVLVPLAAMFTRRVHDTGHSAWWAAAAGAGVIYPLVQPFVPLPLLISGILNLLCFVALIYVLVLTACPSDEKNEYGAKPEETVLEKRVSNIFVVIFFGLVVWHIYAIMRAGVVLPEIDTSVSAQLPHHTVE